MEKVTGVSFCINTRHVLLQGPLCRRLLRALCLLQRQHPQCLNVGPLWQSQDFDRCMTVLPAGGRGTVPATLGVYTMMAIAGAVCTP